MKKCFKCGIEKELTEFYKHPEMPDGTVNKCKECNKKDVRENRLDKKEYYDHCDRNRPNHEDRVKKQAERVKQLWHTDEDFKQSIIAHKQKWQDQNQHKRKAQYAVSNAKRDGKLVASAVCEHCGTSEKKIQGHHWSYLPEHWLDVIWLCTSCHGKEHKRLNAIGRDPDKQTQEGVE
jgi:hypothetical protein